MVALNAAIYDAGVGHGQGPGAEYASRRPEIVDERSRDLVGRVAVKAWELVTDMASRAIEVVRQDA